MFLKIQFLEGKKRNKFFKKYPPKYIYVNSSRQNCARNGDFITYPGSQQPVMHGLFGKKDLLENQLLDGLIKDVRK